MQDRAYSVLEIKAVSDDERTIEGIATTPSTDRMGDINALQARIRFLQLHELLDDLLGWPTQKGSTLHRTLNGRQSGIGGLFGIAHGLDLLVGQGSHQA